MMLSARNLSPPFVPWGKIAALAALSAPPVLLAYALGMPHAAAVIGFATGFLATLAGGVTWAGAATLAAALAYGLAILLPGEGYYITGLALCALSLGSVRFGGGRAMTYSAVGWVFLTLYDFGSSPDHWALGVFVIAALWAIPSAWWLGVSGLTAPKPPFVSVRAQIAVVITAGFMATLMLADLIDMPRPYWVPFVFLHVVAATGLGATLPALRRLLGAVLGVTAIAVFLPDGTPAAVMLILAAVALTIALRVLPAFPVVARALTTAGILLVLLPTEDRIADARLLAEILGTLVLCITTVLVWILSPSKTD
ncbi:MAG: FUSC family protein [Pseudomonadota bacterium]